MSYSRSNIKRGRGQIVFGGETLFSKTPIEVNWLQRTFKVQAANHGNVDTRDQDRLIEIKFTPAGQITADQLGVLYPHLDAAYGSKALGGSDAAAVIYFEADNQQLTVHNAVVFQQPDLNLKVGQTPFGQCTLHGLVRDTYEPNASNAYYTLAGVSYPGDADFAATEIKAGLFKAVWGSDAPWSEFWSKDGFRVQFGTQLIADGPDGTLTRDYIVGNQVTKVTCNPKGITVAQLSAKLAGRFQGSGAPLGSVSMAGATPDDLIISNSDLYFRLYKAGIDTSMLKASPTEDVTGQMVFFADRSLTAGAGTPVAYLGVSAPA